MYGYMYRSLSLCAHMYIHTTHTHIQKREREESSRKDANQYNLILLEAVPEFFTLSTSYINTKSASRIWAVCNGFSFFVCLLFCVCVCDIHLFV